MQKNKINIYTRYQEQRRDYDIKNKVNNYKIKRLWYQEQSKRLYKQNQVNKKLVYKFNLFIIHSFKV